MWRSMLLLVLLATTARACEWTACDADCGGGSRVCSRVDKNDVSINCHMQGCNEGDISDCGPADIVFVLDSSGSLGEMNWWRTKQFAIDISRGMNIGLDDTRVGLVVFSGKAKVAFELGEYNDREPLEEAIWNRPFMKSKTNTKAALEAAEAMFERSGRKGVKSIAIVVTDGISNLGAEQTVPQAESMHAKGIEIFAIGIGKKVDKTEVNGIASNPDDAHAYFISSYKQLAMDISNILEDICDATKLIECDDWNEKWTGECVVIDQERDCGEGLQNKTRECRSFFWEGGPALVLTDTAEIPCWGEPCPPPPCTWTECDKPCGGGRRYCDEGDGRVKKIRCNVQSCEKVTDCDPTDVVFLLDSSGSIGPKNWARTKQFAMDVSKGLPIAVGGTHVAAVSYSKGAHIAWSLNEMFATDPVAVQAKLWEMHWRKGRTNTRKGLEVAKKILLASKRENARKILITITDGLSNVNPELTIPEAIEINNLGIQSFCLALKQSESEEFAAIASEPHSTYLHYLKDYGALTAITNMVIRETCAAGTET